MCYFATQSYQNRPIIGSYRAKSGSTAAIMCYVSGRCLPDLSPTSGRVGHILLSPIDPYEGDLSGVPECSGRYILADHLADLIEGLDIRPS